jgi:hypothetical protein
MPVGDFPTVFPTILKCWLNRMVTSENGIIHRRCCIFSKPSFFIDHVLFLIMSNFFGKYLYILHIQFYNLQYDVACFLHMFTFFIVHGKICLQFTCICCIFAVPYAWKTRNGRKMRQTFRSFRGSGLNK